MRLKSINQIRTFKNGEYITYKKGEIFDIEPKDGEALIKYKAAKKILGFEEDEEPNKGKVVYLTKDELLKMKKTELIDYAKSVGLKLDEKLKNETMIDTILNELEEKQELNNN